MRKTVNDFGEGGRHVGVVFLVFCMFLRLLRSVRVEFDGRSRGAGGIREAAWLDSVVTTDNRGKGAKRH
jgi:hypothetical protein